MKFLAIDTSLAYAIVLAGNAVDHWSQIDDLPRSHNLNLWSMIKQQLLAMECDLSQLDFIAVTHGPGSFTGVRIGHSAVQAIALVNQLPVVTLSGLQLLAQAQYLSGGQHKLEVIQDARNSHLYQGIYQLNTVGIMEVHGSMHYKPLEYLSSLDASIQIIGDAGLKYHDLLSSDIKNLMIDPHFLPEALSQLARFYFQEGAVKSVEALDVLYLEGQSPWQPKHGLCHKSC